MGLPAWVAPYLKKISEAFTFRFYCFLLEKLDHWGEADFADPDIQIPKRRKINPIVLNQPGISVNIKRANNDDPIGSPRRDRDTNDAGRNFNVQLNIVCPNNWGIRANSRIQR